MSAVAHSVSFLICSTPRSGSTLLCEALRNTGLAGRPEEYFQELTETGRPRSPLVARAGSCPGGRRKARLHEADRQPDPARWE